MKRVTPCHRGILLSAGMLLLAAGLAWGAAAGPEAGAKRATPSARPARTSSAHSRTAARSTAASRDQAARIAARREEARRMALQIMMSSQLPAASAPAPGAAAMRIFRDPETGEIGPPTAENVRQIAEENRNQPENRNVPQVKLANGGWMIETGQFEDAVIMQIDKNGNRVMSCVQDAKAAHKAAAHKAAAPAPAKEDR